MNMEPMRLGLVVPACLLLAGCLSNAPATDEQIAYYAARGPGRNAVPISPAAPPDISNTPKLDTPPAKVLPNSAPPQTVALPTTAGTNSSGTPVFALTDPVFVGLVTAEMAECEKNAEKMGFVTAASRGTQLGIATVGIIAGSIVVPALAAKATVARATVAAWGGISGAANAAQAAMTSSGLSPEQTVAAQRVYLADIAKIVTELKTLKEGPDAASFIMRLRFQCRMGVPLTDASAPAPLGNVR